MRLGKHLLSIARLVLISSWLFLFFKQKHHKIQSNFIRFYKLLRYTFFLIISLARQSQLIVGFIDLSVVKYITSIAMIEQLIYFFLFSSILSHDKVIKRFYNILKQGDSECYLWKAVQQNDLLKLLSIWQNLFIFYELFLDLTSQNGK